MSEHQHTQQSNDSKYTGQNKTSTQKLIPLSNPMVIIQRAKINPKSLTHSDVLQLQRTIGNRAVGRLLSEIGLIPSNGKKAPPVQMQTTPEEEMEPLQDGILETIQRQEVPEEEEPLQGKFESKPEQEICPSCSSIPIQREKENRTGMPDNLKTGVENLSGIDMSDVRVHYNSEKPAEVRALAYTQGTDIHVSPGQEQYLPHEVWHVVQQKQGRVRPTIQLMNGESGNDDAELERESDVMGKRAVVMYHPGSKTNHVNVPHNTVQLQNNNIIQCAAIDTLTNEVEAAYSQKDKYYPHFGTGSAPGAWTVRKPFIVNKRVTFHHIINKETLLQNLKRFGWINASLVRAINPEYFDEDEENYQDIAETITNTYGSINSFFTAIQYNTKCKNYLWRPGNVFSGINLDNRADNPGDSENEPIKPFSVYQQDWDNVRAWSDSLNDLASFSTNQITNANVIQILERIKLLLDTALQCTNAVKGEGQPHFTYDYDWELVDGRWGEDGSHYKLRLFPDMVDY